ncbi:MAG: hypothetical protein GY719_42235 [bacterium]|nr:hypothetical protein [bacterium]
MVRFFLRLLAAIVVLVVIAVAWFVVSTLATERRIEQTWHEEIFAGLELHERFPSREVNETARRLEDLGTSLGIDFTAQHRPLPAAPAPEDAARFEAVEGTLKEWSGEAYAATSGPLPDLPAGLESYLTWAETGLGDVEELLLRAEPPAWELDVSLRFEMPLPNYLGQMHLHRLLSVRALQLLREGSFEAADRSLEAAWRLRQATERDPLLIGQLVALAQAKAEHLVLRRHCAADERWHRRLEETERASRMLLAIQIDAWAVSDGWRRGLGMTEEGPYVPAVIQRYGAVDYAEAMQHGIERLRTQDPRNFDNALFFEEEYARIPRWNIVSRLLFPDLFGAWLKAVRAELHAELTLGILRQRGGEGAPARGRIDSSAVPGAFWAIEPEGDGTRLDFQGTIDELSDRSLALEYTLSAADCRHDS